MSSSAASCRRENPLGRGEGGRRPRRRRSGLSRHGELRGARVRSRALRGTAILPAQSAGHFDADDARRVCRVGPDSRARRSTPTGRRRPYCFPRRASASSASPVNRSGTRTPTRPCWRPSGAISAATCPWSCLTYRSTIPRLRRPVRRPCWPTSESRGDANGRLPRLQGKVEAKSLPIILKPLAHENGALVARASPQRGHSRADRIFLSRQVRARYFFCAREVQITPVTARPRSPTMVEGAGTTWATLNCPPKPPIVFTAKPLPGLNKP